MKSNEESKGERDTVSVVYSGVANESFSLRIEARKQQLPLLQEFIEERAPSLRVSTDALYAVLVAATEIVTNSIVHGYAGEPGVIDIEMWATGSDLCVRVRDGAPAFDPTSVPTPDTNIPLDERPPGGMGIHVTRRFVDTINYRAMPQGGNELILIRNNVIEQGEP